MKSILKTIIVMVSLIVIYFISLIAVSLIPSSAIKANVKESAEYFMTKDEIEHVNIGFKGVKLFQFTNALMVNIAYSIDSTNPIEAMLTAKKNYIPEVTKTVYTNTPKDLQSAKHYYENGIITTDAYQIQELYDTVNENNLYDSFEYARYWHGYLLYLRPLLLVFNYQQITVLLFFIVLYLLMMNTYLTYKKFGAKIASALCVSYIAVDVFVVTQSINEITCFIIAMIFSNYLLTRKDYNKNIYLLFLIIGSVTNFLDFLTNPIITYGMPILIYFLICEKEKKLNWKEILILYSKTAIMWFIGYSVTWAVKWLITDIILDRNVIQNALEQILYRTSGKDYMHLQLVDSLKVFLTLITRMFLCAWMIAWNFKNKPFKNLKTNLKKPNLYVIFAWIPCLYYIVLSIGVMLGKMISIIPNIDKMFSSIPIMGIMNLDTYYGILKYWAISFIDPAIICLIISMFLHTLEIKEIKDFKNIKKLSYILPSIIGIFIPIVWYVVLLNHTIVHAFFTYRNLVVSIFAIQVCLIELIRKQKEKIIEK